MKILPIISQSYNCIYSVIKKFMDMCDEQKMEHMRNRLIEDHITEVCKVNLWTM